MEVEVERMQVFFPASLEIQEELLKAGFKVPYDKESGKKTPVPIVASYRNGKVIKRGKLLKAKKYEEDGKYLRIGREKTTMNIDVNDRGFMTFTIKPVSYHLEDMGFTTVPPRLWGTWVSLSLSPKEMWRLYDAVPEDESSDHGAFHIGCNGNGREIDIHAYKGKGWRALGIPVFAYGFGLRNLPLAMEYLEEKALENNIDVRRLRYLKLGLKKLKETKAGLKVGISWSEGEVKRFNLRLSTTAPKVRIEGLYGELIGRSRGGLGEVDEWNFVVHGTDFRNAIEVVDRTVHSAKVKGF